MVINQLNLNYLTSQIGQKEFKLLYSAYTEIVRDGHFEENYSEKKIASTFFEIQASDTYFRNRKNAINFFYALPSITQEKLLNSLGIAKIELLTDLSEYVDLLIESYQLDEKFRITSEEVSKQNNTSGFKHFSPPAHTFKKLKDYQCSVFFPTYQYLSEVPFARCVIQMPTGSGKTRTSMEIVCEFINETGKDVLWLANTEELCDQAYHTFNETWEFLRSRECIAINHVRVKNQTLPTSPKFHVCSLQSLNFNRKSQEEVLEGKGIKISGIGLIVVDEAHISIAPTYKFTIESLLSKGAKLIGLTATPGRELSTGGSDENMKLSDFYFNKKFEISLNNVEESPIENLRKRGILSNVTFHSIEGSSLEKILSRRELEEIKLTNKIPKKVEVLLTNDSRRTALIFDKLLYLLKTGRKILFFGSSIAHSQLISSLVKMIGFEAAHIDGNSGQYRQKTIKDFKSGKIQLLCNYSVLTTGFDDPKVDVVFMARPTCSIVLYSQIIGRGLRGPVIGGTENCEIYTVIDNIADLPDNENIYSYFDEYFMNLE